MTESKLFSTITVGNFNLNHRIVLAPLSRFRNTEDGVPQAQCIEYYEQRTTENGLLISEATMISADSNGYAFAPGIYTDAQVDGWKSVVNAVHAKGGIIFNQLWHIGRAGGTNTISASSIPIRGLNFYGRQHDVPVELTNDGIKYVIQKYAKAAQNAMVAGFDGVELHAANGYLIDQFINSSSNLRTDEYGGSIENRARFALDVIDAVVEAVGAKKVAIRLSPWSEFNDMKDETPVATWSFIIRKLQKRHPDLAYIHFIEARMSGHSDIDIEPEETLGPFHDIWKGPVIYCGGYNRDKAIQKCEERENSLVAFGRVFIANPDLVERFRHGFPLNKYDRPTFYTQGTEGFTDYPFYSDNDKNKILI